MKAVAGGFLLLLAVASGRQLTTPVDRVIALLTKLTATVQAEGAAEAESYDKYACFCKDQADAKVYVIAKADKKIGEFDADITALTTEITNLDDEVSSKKKDVEADEAKQAENQKIRNAERDEYMKKRADLAKAVEAVGTALETLQNSEKDVREEITSLLQKLPTQSLSTSALALIAQASAGPGEAKAYNYGSKEIIATLQTLQATFKKDLADLDESEISTRSDFEMGAGARSNTITATQKAITEKETLSASKGEEKSNAEEELNQETTARNADQAFLDDLTAKCEAKATAWDTRSTTRANELTALTKATETLKGMGDLYNSNSKLVGFLQLRSVRHHSMGKEGLDRLTTRLNKQAHALHSTPLAMLAVQLEAAGPDHFVKVRGIIKDLIQKLKDDAKAEATAKGICDTDMKAAVEKRDKGNADIETANAQIDTTEAEIGNLKKEIADLAEDIAGLNKEKQEATELREKEKEENDKTIDNAKEGKKAVDSAISVLQKFYEGAFLQQSPNIKNAAGETVGDLAPDAGFSSDDTDPRKGEASKGIIGMLEVIASDFDRTATTVTAAEATAVEDYNKLKADIESSITDKEKLKETKEGDVETKGSDLTGFKDDLKTATTMNEEALEELDKLKTACVDGSESYEERVQKRKDEIEALKSALQTLEEWQS